MAATLRRNLIVVLSALILGTVTVAALFAPVLAPHDPTAQNLGLMLRPPIWEGGTSQYLLGTDALGRDILSRIIYGSRISLLVGFSVVLIQAVVGIVLGLAAGYFGGWLDALVMRLGDVQLAIPFMVLAIAVMAVLGGGLRNVIIVLGVTGWVTFGRVIRSEVLSVREREFVESARALGGSHWRIIFRHILPNVATSMLVLSTLELARVIIAEASLAYLGLGVQPPTPTWGGMIADGRNWIMGGWWVSTLPGLAIFVTVLSINLLGDYVRDVLDPTHRNL